MVVAYHLLNGEAVERKYEDFQSIESEIDEIIRYYCCSTDRSPDFIFVNTREVVSRGWLNPVHAAHVNSSKHMVYYHYFGYSTVINHNEPGLMAFIGSEQEFQNYLFFKTLEKELLSAGE